MRTRIEVLLGRRITAAREARSWTQAELAEKCGMSTQTLGRLERGQQTPALDRIEGVARALDVQLADLLRRRDAPSRRERALERLTTELQRGSADEAELVLDLAKCVLSRRRR